MKMPSPTEILRQVDQRLWRGIFGSASYMQLRPPLVKRLKILARLPLHLVAPVHCKRPVFIVGAPRSGTTLLFRLLSASPHFGSLKRESHWIWEFMHPPGLSSDYSQVIRASDVTPKMRRYVRSCYGAAFDSQRFVDKSPANSFRINAIREIFPDAKFVFLTRNGPDNVNSLLNSWRSSRFEGFDVPVPIDIDGYNGTKWKHILQPGWQHHAYGRLEEVCVHQWSLTNRHLLDAHSNLPASAVTWVRYEDLFVAPVPTVQSLLQSLDVPAEDEVMSIASSLGDNVVNASSSPGIVKWKNENPVEVSRVLDDLRPVMEGLGYDFTAYT
jgi:hypothetical protein